MIALVSPTDEITILNSGPGSWRLEVPGTTITVSPVVAGWGYEGWRILDVEPFTPPEGKVITGGPFYNLADGIVVETYSVVDPPAPAQITNENYGYARFGYTSSDGVVIKDQSQRIGGVTRMSTGRYRVRDLNEGSVELVVRSLLVRDPSTSPINWHVSATTTLYVEIRLFKWSGGAFAAFDPAEVIVELDKVVLQ